MSAVLMTIVTDIVFEWDVYNLVRDEAGHRGEGAWPVVPACDQDRCVVCPRQGTALADLDARMGLGGACLAYVRCPGDCACAGRILLDAYLAAPRCRHDHRRPLPPEVLEREALPCRSRPEGPGLVPDFALVQRAPFCSSTYVSTDRTCSPHCPFKGRAGAASPARGSRGSSTGASTTRRWASPALPSSPKRPS